MEAQIQNVQRLIPDILTQIQPTRSGLCEAEIRMYQLFATPERDRVKEAGVALGNELNSTVVPEVVAGRVAVDPHTGAIASLGDQSFTLPMTLATAKALYQVLDPSKVGVELRGDVLDTDLRRSHEVLASRVDLPVCLRSFDFPDELRRIHEGLCPSAEAIRVEPYKLIVYGPGDFFVPHRDSMDEEDMFGTISLGLPVLPSTSAKGSKEGVEEEAQTSRGSNSAEIGGPGQLVLFVGQRASDVTVPSMVKEEEVFKKNPLTYVVDMEAVMAGETGTATTMSLGYGAWTGDVLHEVKALDKGYRAVLTYRLYKQGHRESYIPAALRASVEAQLVAIVTNLSSFPQQNNDSGGERVGPEKFGMRLGFCLRHSYPVLGLKPHCLKGVDAVVYSIVSRLYDTALFTGLDVRQQEMTEVRVYEPGLHSRVIFLTKERPDVCFGDEDTLEYMATRYPIVTNTLWLSLGYGALLGGGFCYGNWDCGTDWWYRQAYLLVGPPKTPAAAKESTPF